MSENTTGTEPAKKTRGPMSEDARILQVKRKMLNLPMDTRAKIATLIGTDDGNSDLEDVAETHAAIASVLKMAAPLSGDGRRTLLAMVR